MDTLEAGSIVGTMVGFRTAVAGIALASGISITACDENSPSNQKAFCTLTVSAIGLLAEAFHAGSDWTDALKVLSPALQAACESTVRTLVQRPTMSVSLHLDASGRLVDTNSTGTTLFRQVPRPAQLDPNFQHLFDCWRRYPRSGLLNDLCVNGTISP